MLRDAVYRGGRAFVVFPLINESDSLAGMRAATQEFELLTQPGGLLDGEMDGKGPLTCGLVYSTLPEEEKEEAMAAFNRGDIDVRRYVKEW